MKSYYINTNSRLRTPPRTQ